MQKTILISIFVIYITSMAQAFTLKNRTEGYIFKSDNQTDELFMKNFGNSKFDYPYRNIMLEDDDFTYKISAGTELEFSGWYNSDDDNDEDDYNIKGVHRILFKIGENVNIYNEMLMEKRLADDPNYQGKVWNDIAGFTRSAFIEYNKSFFTARFGKYPVEMGVSNFDNFLFSETNDGYTKLYFRAKFNRFGFDTFSGKLGDNDRNISMHRVSFDFGKYLKLYISESVVYTGNVNWEYINPFTSYYGIQQNDDMPGNVLGTLEAESYVTDYLRIYGAFLLDDIQVDNEKSSDLEPAEIGFMIGFSYLNLFFDKDLFEYEYSGITNRTYNTPTNREGEKYFTGTVEDGYYELIGNKLGCDFDIHRLKYTLFKFDAKLSLLASYLRKGEGDPRKEFDEPWLEYTVDEGYSEPFPTGDVNEVVSLRLEGEKTFFDYLKGKLFIDIKNESETDDTFFKAGAVVSADIDYLIYKN